MGVTESHDENPSHVQPDGSRLWGIDLLAGMWLVAALALGFVLERGNSSARPVVLALLPLTLWFAWATFKRKRFAWWVMLVWFSSGALLDVLALGYCVLAFFGVELPGVAALYPRVCKVSAQNLTVCAPAALYLLRPSVQAAFRRRTKREH